MEYESPHLQHSASHLSQSDDFRQWQPRPEALIGLIRKNHRSPFLSKALPIGCNIKRFNRAKTPLFVDLKQINNVNFLEPPSAIHVHFDTSTQLNLVFSSRWGALVFLSNRIIHMFYSTRVVDNSVQSVSNYCRNLWNNTSARKNSKPSVVETDDIETVDFNLSRVSS